MSFSENGSTTAKPAETKRGMLETVKGWFVREKPQTGPDRLVLLSETLRATEKRKLAAEIRCLKERDVHEKTPDLRAYAVSLFAEEIAAGSVTMEELSKLADIFCEHAANPPKKVDAYYTENLVGKITYSLHAKEEAEIIKRSEVLANKILTAPKKLTSDLGAFADKLEEEVRAEQEAFLAEPHGELTPEDLKRVIFDYPDEFESIVSKYELVALKAKMIEGSGMADPVKAVRNFETDLSPVDGTLFKTVADRISYLETLANLGEVKAKWYELKPPGYSRTFAREFIANEVIPRAIASDALFEDVVKQIHWYQISGSNEQKSITEKIGRNWAGEYRKEKVSISGDTIHCSCPEQEQVPDLMAKFGKQVELFSAEIERLRQTTSPEEFEKLVVQYACLVLHRFTSIHPMADGNGRTSRSLYEYVVARHLGQIKMAEYSAEHFGPQETLPATVKYQQVDMSQRAQMNFHPGDALYDQVVAQDPNFLKRTGFEHANLVAHLENTDFDFEVVNNKDLAVFADSIIAAIKANKK